MQLEPTSENASNNLPLVTLCSFKKQHCVVSYQFYLISRKCWIHCILIASSFFYICFFLKILFHAFVLVPVSPYVCDMLPSSLTFDVSVPSPICVGVVAQYTCEIGYELTSGSTQRTCQASAAWDEDEPNCTKATCPVTYNQICYNCDIVDSICIFVHTPATFDECRSSAIIENSTIVEYNDNICKTYSCRVPQITHSNGSVVIFPSCFEG